MLHEILLGLLGKSGNIIIEQDGTFALDMRISFLTPAEKQLINTLASLGYFYKSLESFLDANYYHFARVSHFNTAKG